MTQDKNTDLTPEEQAEIAEKMPALLKAIESESPVAVAWLASWRSKRSVGEEAKEQADAIRQEVAAAPQEQGNLAQWCGFPTEMTRCSPFFPMPSYALGKREYLENYVITSASWGEIKYTGPKLSTYEEDILLVLLAVLDGQSQYRQETCVLEAVICGEELTEVLPRALHGDPSNGGATKLTLTYKGPALPLLRLLGYARPNKKDYERMIAALERMTVAGVKLSISAGKTKSGKCRSPHTTQMSAMLSGVHWDDKEKILTATMNPFFYETYMAGRVTLMDVVKRVQLKGIIAKALYRFIQSQQQSVFTCHFLTLADALNMDREQPIKETKRQLKVAVFELIRQGVLTKKSRFVEQDILKLERTAKALPTREKESYKKH